MNIVIRPYRETDRSALEALTVLKPLSVLLCVAVLPKARFVDVVVAVAVKLRV